MASKKEPQDEQEQAPETITSEQTLADGRTVLTEAQVLEVPQPEVDTEADQSARPRNTPRPFVTLGGSNADGIPQFNAVDVTVRDRNEGE